METEQIIARLKSFEQQLRALRMQVTERQSGNPPRTFAQLRGVWRSAAFSEEEIEATKYRFTFPPKA